METSQKISERARIRALAVVRMNMAREEMQRYEDEADDDAAHGWRLAMNILLGLIREIDEQRTA